MRTFLLCSLCLAISGCFMQPVALPEMHQYLLTSCSLCFPAVNHSQKTLFVNLPNALPPYNQTHMVYSLCPNEIGYFAENRWAALPNQMLLPLIVQSIRNAHCFKKIVGFPTLVDTDYQLNTTLISLKQEFYGQKSYVHVILDATLIAAQSRKVLATKHIDVCTPTRCKTPGSGVVAYRCALDQVLSQLIEFLSTV